ncbi:acetyl-CoA acetyltransferase [Emticicia oligotrophica DSM 17448]|uniref:acetyl-CoA C-acetyltransferase n=1 Tax=Emticicia oligotrophica (strain DSM 17448 / CIP 109782 / MTCC 6937 / GPTSA100-15) TaxID=929562 RepID=A0ABN4ATG9_EMTOG|nr:acetyl-CoA C-acyltransferase [Emticicia oligotrophica]AFK05246.1 acetyl-CoA acetyltransferase [Emticicia oligotrophica DSM 17448]
MQQTFIISAVRTPIGSFGGSLSSVSAPQLGATAIKAAVEKAGIAPNQVEEVLFGNVCQANVGQAPARQATLGAGLSNKTNVTTINKVCASGMKSVMFGSQSIELGQNDIVVAGGMESMSQIPFYLAKARYGYGYGNGELIDGLAKDGLTNVYDNKAMGCFADATATSFEITREEQDAFAIQSYKRSASASVNGNFTNEIVPVEVVDRKGNVKVIAEDEEYKNVNFDKIPTLRPVFTKDGTVTAANASTINDGAAALVLASSNAVEQNNLKPIAKIIAYADGEHEPEWFTTAPIIAAEKALKRAGLTINDIDFFEVNEAFAVVPMAFAKHFGIDHAKLNIYGGAVSLGHPLGCSGARIITTLVNVLAQNNGKYGMAAICNGGGGASAIIIEKI